MKNHNIFALVHPRTLEEVHLLWSVQSRLIAHMLLWPSAFISTQLDHFTLHINSWTAGAVTAETADTTFCSLDVCWMNTLEVTEVSLC